jgi:tetrahydromethanopterin S-methyltransferase subunit C
MTNYIFCLVSDMGQAQSLVQTLSEIGVERDQISLLSANPQDSDRLAGDLRTEVTHGGFTGANIGGAIGWLVGLSNFAIPGIGLFVAAGPIVGFLAGIIVGEKVGNLKGAMMEEMGIPDDLLARFETGLKAGQIVVSVKVPANEKLDRVLEVVRLSGATEIGFKRDAIAAVIANK